MKKVLVILTFVFIANFTLSSESALACKCVERSMNESFQKSDAVFKGKLVKIEKVAFSENKHRIIFEVSEAWKGVKESQVDLVMERTSCSVDFSKGKEYVVFAYELEGNLETGLCTPTKEVNESFAALNYLGQGETDLKVVNHQEKSQFSLFVFAGILVGLAIIVVLFKKKK